LAESVKIAGLGAVSCGEYAKEIEQNPRQQRDNLAWAQGYMSGIIVSRPAGVDEDLNLTPTSFPLLKQLEFLREFCTQQPTVDFSYAVEGLYKAPRTEGVSQ
jgi:hypothetical protein